MPNDWPVVVFFLLKIDELKQGWGVCGHLVYSNMALPNGHFQITIENFWGNQDALLCIAEDSSPDSSSPDSSSPDSSSPENSSLQKKFPGGGTFFAGGFFVQMILRQIILRWRYFARGWNFLHRNILRPNHSSAEYSLPGWFFAGEFFARIVLRSDNSSPDDSSPENSSLKNGFSRRWLILRRIILRPDNFSRITTIIYYTSSPESSSLGKFFTGLFFAWLFFTGWFFT
jgi:hypothetical protein